MEENEEIGWSGFGGIERYNFDIDYLVFVARFEAYLAFADDGGRFFRFLEGVAQVKENVFPCHPKKMGGGVAFRKRKVRVKVAGELQYRHIRIHDDRRR